MKKGTRIKKLPLTVKEQMKLLEIATSLTEYHKTLITFFLSKGIHPSCLYHPRKYELTWDKNYISWRRTKTGRLITSSWSKLMRGETANLRKLLGKSVQRYWQYVKEAGNMAGITGLCPLRLRYTYFTNRGRLGHHPYDVSASSGTSMDTIYNYYTVGKEEMEKLTNEERKFLKELIEP